MYPPLLALLKTRWLRALPAGLLALAAALVQAQSTTAIDYVRPRQLSGFVVSPSNKHAAFLMIADNGRRVAAVIDLERPGVVKPVGYFNDADVTRVAWVNDRRLVYEAYEPGAQIHASGAGTFAVDLDGERVRQLITWRSDNETTGTRLRARMLKTVGSSGGPGTGVATRCWSIAASDRGRMDRTAG